VDAALLCRHFFSLDRPGLAIHGEEPCPGDAARAFLQAVEERAARRPLQYILGRWEFMGFSLRVGEGVLVPREDTATLVEALAGRLEKKPGLRGADLCAGSGAVALGLCRLCPGLEMDCVELSPGALGYLRENLAAYPEYGARVWEGDVLLPETAAQFAELDVVASNPPYIAQWELPTLPPEVRREPPMALDGGPDGLLFYRAIAQLWVPRMKAGGLLGVEIGEGQAEGAVKILRQAGLEDLRVHKDWAGLDRAVTGYRK